MARVVVFGLPGSGKSTLASKLKQQDDFLNHSILEGWDGKTPIPDNTIVILDSDLESPGEWKVDYAFRSERIELDSEIQNLDSGDCDLPDVWEEEILIWLNNDEQKAYNWFSGNQILKYALKLSMNSCNSIHIRRLKHIMQDLGWLRICHPSSNHCHWGYQRPSKERLAFCSDAEFDFRNPYFDNDI